MPPRRRRSGAGSRSSAPASPCGRPGEDIPESRPGGARARAAAGAAAAGLLAILLLARNPPAELARRARFLERTAALEPARRRLAGSSTAFDRPLFVFLESARRSLPPAAAGVGLYMPDPSEAALHLAAYEIAPRPVRLAPVPLPAGWIAAIYGPAPPGWTVVRALPGGALALPPAAP